MRLFTLEQTREKMEEQGGGGFSPSFLALPVDQSKPVLLFSPKPSWPSIIGQTNILNPHLSCIDGTKREGEKKKRTSHKEEEP